ncbi:hypothetical protein AKJ37_06495 [candidate division MSBL1 archaeon SCGC-AAA259I09]|uniref:Transposase IS4-like domain-containing protein n=1 Tax=candidate division MSBL1 archaeon SCGC-AAA259I09 TaxID=1698267 RepID=A0A133UP85_9EURY|nr:hypothetical protein AKJ37_06495 [candidate division MSBL1 archaeon SCGC-AAA259I09]
MHDLEEIEERVRGNDPRPLGRRRTRFPLGGSRTSLDGFRSNAKLSGESLKSFASLFDPTYNSVYDSFDLAQTVRGVGMDEASAERQSRPSPDVILRRLHEVDEENAREKVEKLNEWILEVLFSSKELVIVIDFTVIPYYGKENPMLVSDSRLPGTNLGIKFAVLSVVEDGKTITLKTKQVNPLKSKVSVLEELLDYAEKLLDPRLALLDRGFYSVEAIRELKSRNMDFIMPANKTVPVKEICKKFKRGEASSGTDYTVSGRKGEEEVRLLLTEKETENGTETHPFITNLNIEPDKASENYSWRWRIETNIRELDKFKPFTTSRSMKLRRLYFLISMILYNLWILTRNGKEHPRAHEFKDWLKIELTALKIQEDSKTKPPPSSTPA